MRCGSDVGFACNKTNIDIIVSHKVPMVDKGFNYEVE